MKLIPVKYAESALPESWIFENGDKDKTQPIIFMVFVIKTGDRLILVDTGCETLPGFDMKNFIGPIKALKKEGISPSDITDVIITHSHGDHIECVKYFKNSVIYIQQDEYEEGKDNFTDEFKVVTFDDEYKLTDDITIVKIGGHSIGSSVVEIKTDDKTIAIVGDECYKRVCLEKKLITNRTYNPQKSRAFIEKYSDKSKYITYLSHDV